MKVAISLPDPVFDAAERLAAYLQVSRSQLYADAISAYLKTRGAMEVREQLNAVYGNQTSKLDDDLYQAQVLTLRDEAW